MWQICVASLLVVATLSAPARAVERPPQFVVMAFDNCTELERWQELKDFAAAMNGSGSPLHFTFFVSGVNFIANAFRDVYAGPGQRRGGSNIGFGGTADEVRQRVDYVNALYQQGHEIASHALGHFSGRGWSAGDWGKEFTAYRDVLANVGTINGLGSDVKLAFPASAVIGFRAPYLNGSPALYPALKANGFRYDTSGDSAPDAWPEKIDGIWPSIWRGSSCTAPPRTRCRWTTIFSSRSRAARSSRTAARSFASRSWRPTSTTSSPTTWETARRSISAIISSIIRTAPTRRR